MDPLILLMHAGDAITFDTLRTLVLINKSWSKEIDLVKYIKDWMKRDFVFLYDCCITQQMDLDYLITQSDLDIPALLELLALLPIIYERGKNQHYRKHLRKFVNDTLYKKHFDKTNSSFDSATFLIGLGQYVMQTYPNMVQNTRFMIIYWVMPWITEHMYKTCMAVYGEVPDEIKSVLLDKCEEMRRRKVHSIIGGFDGYLIERFVEYIIDEL